MKKIVRTLIIMLVVCVSLFSLFGCGGNKEVEGKYYLSSGNGQNGGGPLYSLLAKNSDGTYKNIVGGVINPKEFWVELKDGEMTIHGEISAASGPSLAYNADSEFVKTFKYKLETSTTNEAWYSIYDGDEDTLYKVLKSGKSLSFEYGEQKGGFWYSVFYEKGE